MRSLYALLLAASGLACVTAWRSEPPKPKLRTVGATFVIAPDSSVRASASVYVNGNMQPTDDIRFAFQRNDSTQVTVIARAVTADTAMGAPAYGTTATYRVCAQMRRNGSVVASQVCSLRWSYTRNAPPPAVIDSVKIIQASATVAPGGSFQFSVASSTGEPVVWSVVGVGTVNQTGRYTAPL